MSVPHQVPIPLMPKVKQELDRMEKLAKVNGPTDWCSGMVFVNKPGQKVRICGFNKAQQLREEGGTYTTLS